MQQFVDFFMQIQSRRWRVLLMGLLLIGGITLMFWIGKQQFLAAEGELALWLGGTRANGWGLLATIFLFTASAFVGAPQFVLIALCVLVFGPWHGFAYSWLATIASAAVTYWVGRGPAARTLDRFGGKGVDQLKHFIGRNSFMASFIIRNVPSAPFIVVNAAFGAVRARFISFITGCALGVLPKTAMVAFFGGSVMTAVKGDGVWSSLILAALAVAWLGVMLAVREWVKARQS